MRNNKYKKKIMLFAINFIIYSIMLIYKYAKSGTLIKLVEGYFLVNLFFLIMIFPVSGIHRLLRKNEFFWNDEIFSKFFQIILLFGSYIVLIRIPNLEMPLDVMSFSILWLYLYFCLIFNAD